MFNKIIAASALVAVIGLVAATAYVFGAGTIAPKSDDAQTLASAPTGPNEGVEVHGRWIIEVADTEGASVTVREFDNALQAPGAALLAQVLAHDKGVGAWVVNVTNALTGQYPCTGDSLLSLGDACRMSQVPGTLADTNAGSLAVAAPTTGANANKLVLSGTVIAGQDGAIDNVSAYIHECAPTSAPQDVETSCAGQGPFTWFSSKQLSAAEAIPVVTGQTVNVTVVFTFQ